MRLKKPSDKTSRQGSLARSIQNFNRQDLHDLHVRQIPTRQTEAAEFPCPLSFCHPVNPVNFLRDVFRYFANPRAFMIRSLALSVLTPRNPVNFQFALFNFQLSI
jgi:hypothetical protein